MGTVDKNGDMQISFQEFIPWYKRMAEKHWRATHGGAPVTFEPPKSEAPKLAAAPPAKPKLPIPKPAAKCIEVTGTGPQMFICRAASPTKPTTAALVRATELRFIKQRGEAHLRPADFALPINRAGASALTCQSTCWTDYGNICSSLAVLSR